MRIALGVSGARILSLALTRRSPVEMAAEAATSVPRVDRSMFNKTITLKALRVPSRKCQEYLKRLHGCVLAEITGFIPKGRYTFNKPRMRCIFPDGPSKDTRLLLLSEELADKGLEGLPKDLRDELQAAQVEAVSHDLTIGYDYWSVEHVLKTLLPEGAEIPTSFETIGHIAHLNLRDEHLPYKQVIGQVVLDKNPALKTVVNKVGSITNEFRVFDMEVIAGKPELETEVRQFNSVFRLNFSEVYWNSRLEAEHKRLVDSFKPTDTIVDMMAGIGPFSIPAAQKGCTVYANDLNPRSIHYLQVNRKRNKVEDKVKTSNMCARDFVRMLLRSPGSGAAASGDAAEPLEDENKAPRLNEAVELPQGGLIFSHAVMNLPASAVEFLDAFNGAFNADAWEGRELPMVHCYTFARSHETEADIQATCERFLGGAMHTPPRIHNVRNVAPGKNMYCVSFRVPAEVAYARTPPTERPAVVSDKRIAEAGDDAGEGSIPKKSRS